MKVKITKEIFKITEEKSETTSDSRNVISLVIKKDTTYITKFVRN
mgnify:FL=1|jgi:hypothetical protein|tara:strand:- start:431 stop:565 length:135 start_codon:yes stop_codon:yes gene_type:complete